jgi:hypothetical protein
MDRTSILPGARSATQPQLGGKYELSSDGGTWVNGRLVKGVWLTEDGPIMGRVLTDALGEYLDPVMTEDGFLFADDGWQAFITRELGGIVRKAA